MLDRPLALVEFVVEEIDVVLVLFAVFWWPDDGMFGIEEVSDESIIIRFMRSYH